ncbi:hypothetical protein R3X27_22175 [Tropicimonas sp. TH_r6]|uniref:hypothetical protein n=1 Tax=Tropicimonas sp. TH_r6 TaxID=3082085 RepID=UPI002955509F|nr:hypothetical protein [Tropicimonas sp. TH_r6]MDV7145402.1 hypothetical protein [Tropicimonas sp. TH_r6]
MHATQIQFTSAIRIEVLSEASTKISRVGKGRWIDDRMIERLWRSAWVWQLWASWDTEAHAVCLVDMALHFPPTATAQKCSDARRRAAGFLFSDLLRGCDLGEALVDDVLNLARAHCGGSGGLAVGFRRDHVEAGEGSGGQIGVDALDPGDEGLAPPCGGRPPVSARARL